MAAEPLTPSTNAPSGTGKKLGDQDSASPSSEIFPTPISRGKGKMSPAPAKRFENKRSVSTPPEITDENHNPGSSKSTLGELPPWTSLGHSWNRQQWSKKKSQYYGEAFAVREPNNTARDRITSDSLITAEIRLNCGVSLVSQISSTFLTLQ